MLAPNWECIGSLNMNIPQMKLTRTINDEAIATKKNYKVEVEMNPVRCRAEHKKMIPSLYSMTKLLPIPMPRAKPIVFTAYTVAIPLSIQQVRLKLI